MDADHKGLPLTNLLRVLPVPGRIASSRSHSPMAAIPVGLLYSHRHFVLHMQGGVKTYVESFQSLRVLQMRNIGQA
jgi:hypothetical protein